ncbi:MAG TPA: efflux RND transporter periplasmic adaptor subunit [Polyangiales bacterium]|nr:efflux RND transporter periplasmic adaptor subunit [Polyangiales bacterium]
MRNRGSVWSIAFALCACHHADATQANKPKAEPAVHVESVVIDERAVPNTITVTGTLEANQRTELAANASGRVTRTFVERGDHVKAGELLAQLDSRGAPLSRVEAEANAKSSADQLASVQAECKRYEALKAKGAITQQEYDKQAAQCSTQASTEEAARARLADAARVVEDAAIRAPFAGVIAERFVNVGDYVQPSSKVVTLLVDDPLRLRISVPEPAIPYAREGTVVHFKVLNLPNRDFTAVIKYVGREVRPTTRDMIDEAIVENHDRALLPGMFVTVELPTGTVNRAIVPQSALVQAGDEPTVFAIVDKRIEQRAVHTGIDVDGGVAVSEGLKTGDRVVVHPPPDLKDGSPVAVR